MKTKCPKCKSKVTWMHHDLKSDTYYSHCKRCGYRSKPTSSYTKADNWLPNGEDYSGDE